MPASKDEIALTFMGLAVRYGFRRTAVEDVARALRISKKTIYEYFPSKEALVEHALELGALQQRRRVESLLTETTALGRALQVTRIALADAREGSRRTPASNWSSRRSSRRASTTASTAPWSATCWRRASRRGSSRSPTST